MKSLLFVTMLSLFSLASFAQGSEGYTIQGQLNTLKKQTATKITAITSGSATTIASGPGHSWVVVDPAATLAAHNIKLPASAVDGQTVTVSFGFSGSLTTGTVVTSLTISPNTSQTIVQGTAPSTATHGQTFAYRFYAAISKWFRLY